MFTECVNVKILLVLYPVVCNKMTLVGSLSPHHVASTIWLATVVCQWYKCLHVDNFLLLDIVHTLSPDCGRCTMSKFKQQFFFLCESIKFDIASTCIQ